MDYDYPLPLSTSSAIIVFAILTPLLIFSFFARSKKFSENNNRKPPEAAGRLPIIGHLHLLARSQPAHIILGNMADKCGPIFTMKLGVHNVLVISNHEMAKECLTTNDKALASRPKSIAMEILGYNYSFLGFSPYGDYWRQMRKIVTLELLSNHRLEMLKHVREAEVKMAIKGLYQEWVKNSTPTHHNLSTISAVDQNSNPGNNDSGKHFVEMKRWFGDTTLNLILKILVGKRYVEEVDNILNEHNSQGEAWTDVLREYTELSIKFSISDALPYLRWLDLGGVEKEMKENIQKVDRVMEEWLEEHKMKKMRKASKAIAMEEEEEEEEEEEDFMSVLLSILEDALELSSDDRDADTINKAICLTLLLGASDTTTVTLTWTLSLLLNNPNILNKVQQELETQVGKERQVKESDIKNLVFLQAVIKESFRLYPAAPLAAPHESTEECAIGGYKIPTGTRLFINISKIQRDPNVWSNPLEFQPERFLTTHKNIDLKGQNFELMPFGSGRRMCPGISFALQVLNLTLATFLHSFEIGTPFDQPVDMTESVAITNIKATPLQVVVSPRLPAHLY